MFLKSLIPIYLIYLVNFFYYKIKYNKKISPKSFLSNCLLWKNIYIMWWCRIVNSSIWDNTYISWTEVWWIFTRIENTEIWKFCSIAHNVQIINISHHSNKLSSYPFFSLPTSPWYDKQNKNDQVVTKVIIWNDVWIGTWVTVIWNVKIWNGAIIAAWAVVTKDVDAYSIVWWVPAKPIKKRFSDEQIEELLSQKWWDQERKLQSELIHKIYNTYETH